MKNNIIPLGYQLTNEMAKVTVLIPTYNSASYLSDAIESVINQTYQDFELFIVDNHSTDNTSEIVAPYLSDKRLTYIVNDSNLGLIGNWNKCLSLASGEYVKFVCSDDKLQNSALEKFVAVLDHNPQVALVSSYFQEFDPNNTNSRAMISPVSGLLDGKAVIRELLAKSNFLGNPSQVMFRRSSVDKVGNFRNMNLWNLDLEYFIRILTTGDCYIIPEILSQARLHSSQASASLIKSRSNYFGNYDLVKILKSNEKEFDFEGLNIDQLIKQKAQECSVSIPRTLWGLTRKENKLILKKALNIVYNEGVVFSSLLYLGKRAISKVRVHMF